MAKFTFSETSRKVMLLVIFLAYLGYGSFLTLREVKLHADDNDQWWFDSTLSVTFVALFLMMSITIFSGLKLKTTQTVWDKGKTYSYVMKRLFYNACFVSALSAVILPAMYLQGCLWYYLCIVYIFSIGFNNILTTPIILSRMEMKKEPGNRKTSHRVASFLSILLPAILVYGLVEFDKSETYIWFFAVISCVSLLLFKFMVKAIIRLWRE